MPKIKLPASFFRQTGIMGLYAQASVPWTGMAARTVIGRNGIGQTSATIFDQHATIGRSMQTLFLRPR